MAFFNFYTFLHSIERLIFFIRSRFLWYTRKPHRKYSGIVNSGELADQLRLLWRELSRWEKISLSDTNNLNLQYGSSLNPIRICIDVRFQKTAVLKMFSVYLLKVIVAARPFMASQKIRPITFTDVTTHQSIIVNELTSDMKRWCFWNNWT